MALQAVSFIYLSICYIKTTCNKFNKTFLVCAKFSISRTITTRHFPLMSMLTVVKLPKADIKQCIYQLTQCGYEWVLFPITPKVTLKNHITVESVALSSRKSPTAIFISSKTSCQLPFSVCLNNLTESYQSDLSPGIAHK